MSRTIYIIFLCLYLLQINNLSAQMEPISIKVWANGAPHSNHLDKEPELRERGLIAHNSEATMKVYLPNKKDATKAAVVICPGGGYGVLAAKHEGSEVAEWFVARGIAAFVLYYRMPNGNKEVPLEDAQEAMKIIRKNSKKWNIDKNKIGVLGFSAGGHLASTLSTHFDKDSRPNFSVLVYPVVSFRNGVGHGGSRSGLLGKDRDSEEWIAYFSNDEQVTAQTPPAILFHSLDDEGVVPANSFQYAEALKKHGVVATVITYPTGGHGWGMNKNGVTEGWVEEVIPFLRNIKIVSE